MTEYRDKIQLLFDEIGKIIVGQYSLKRDILVALFSGGHILLEGAPGLAKTRTIESFAQALHVQFQRIQFTPDLLPSDLLGAKIYDPVSRTFEIKKGPIFANFVLADEINRAPSKVQSALLEAMGEKQITLGEKTFHLDDPFMVLATQNPLEQEGTFRLPEAQMDRFLLQSLVGYPSLEEEKMILMGERQRQEEKIQVQMTKKEISEIQRDCENVVVSSGMYEYITDLIRATRNIEKYTYIAYGASPRAGLALLKTSRVCAYIRGRNYVIPEDVHEMIYAVLRHRIILSYEALALGKNPDMIIADILHDIPVYHER